MSKHKKHTHCSQDNPFKDLSDEQFEIALAGLTQETPTWEECSKEEYEKYCPEIGDTFTKENFEKMLLSASNLSDFRKEPLYKDSGLIHIIMDGIKPSGYKYYKRTGWQKVIICGAKMANWINERRNMTK